MCEFEKMTIWTIGHSTRSFETFLEALRAERIEALADVRGMPGSRRYPHFNSEFLAKALPENKIEYHHFRGLGGRRKPNPESPNDAWRHPAFRAYADHMETAEFANSVATLMELANRRRVAMMCAEAVWWRCHRSLIADFLKARGWTVLHIFAVNSVKEHPYTSAAHFINGELTYSKDAKPARLRKSA